MPRRTAGSAWKDLFIVSDAGRVAAGVIGVGAHAPGFPHGKVTLKHFQKEPLTPLSDKRFGRAAGEPVLWKMKSIYPAMFVLYGKLLEP